MTTVQAVEVPAAVTSTAALSGNWRVEALAGTAEDLHAADVAAERLVRVCLVDRAAIVLGSTQLPGSVAPPSGVEVARRRSGGGAVWLSPGHQVWMDLVVPAGDPLWHDDVSVAAHWMGAAWAAVGPHGSRGWTGAVVRREAGGWACFAGLGPGEVVLGERKLVGVSQRRTRRLARFQCVAYLHHDPEPLLGALVGAPPYVAERLRHGVATLGLGASMWDVVARLVHVLP